MNVHQGSLASSVRKQVEVGGHLLQEANAKGGAIRIKHILLPQGSCSGLASTLQSLLNQVLQWLNLFEQYPKWGDLSPISLQSDELASHWHARRHIMRKQGDIQAGKEKIFF